MFEITCFQYIFSSKLWLFNNYLHIPYSNFSQSLNILETDFNRPLKSSVGLQTHTHTNTHIFPNIISLDTNSNNEAVAFSIVLRFYIRTISYLQIFGLCILNYTHVSEQIKSIWAFIHTYVIQPQQALIITLTSK